MPNDHGFEAMDRNRQPRAVTSSDATHTWSVSRGPKQVQRWQLPPFRSDHVEARGLTRSATGAGLPHQTYRLIALCRATEADAVEAGLKSLLNKRAIRLVSLQRQQTNCVRVRIDAQVASSIPGRAALVQIVNQLATDPAIRFLQWETVPDSTRVCDAPQRMCGVAG